MFDTHTHLSDRKFSKDLDEVIMHARQENITHIVSVCSSVNELNSFYNILASYKFIHGAFGVHPHDAKDFPKSEHLLDSILTRPGIVALGEIGLDYHYNFSPPDIQKQVFRKQLEIARSLNKPVIIHSREAMKDTLEILESESISHGVMHCFSGTPQNMKTCIEMGLYISLAGPVTFPNARSLKDIARDIPLERLLVETDCPYLAPQPVRSKRNEPRYVRYIIDEIALIKNIAREQVEAITTANACTFFNIKGGDTQ